MIALGKDIGKNSGYLMTTISNELKSVAEYFIWKSTDAKKPITNKKLQKLVYYAQAWNLVFTKGQSLFPEPIEAWMHGPAIRVLWLKYKRFAYTAINGINNKPEIGKKVSSLLDEVWKVYGKYDADYLETLTHSEDPWIEARAGLDTNETSSIVITPDAMRSYYSQLNG